MNFRGEYQKMFLTAAGIASLVLALFAYLTLAPLDIHTPDPQAVSAQSIRYIDSYNTINLFTFITLLIISNLIFRKTRKGTYLLYTWLFFSAFTLFSYIYLVGEHFRFTKDTGVWAGGFEIGFILGFGLMFIAGIVCLINHIVLHRNKS